MTDLQPMVAALRADPGTWKELSSDRPMFLAQAQDWVETLRSATETVDGTFEFETRRTAALQYAVYGRFVAPGPQEGLVNRGRDALDESFRRLTDT